MLFALVWALIASRLEAAGVTNVAGARLAFPPECVSKNCTINLGALRLETPTANFTTRGFGDVPGPTIFVEAGDQLRIHLNNLLQNVDNGDDIALNNIRSVNTTNLHTHGLHVSSSAPGDDVFIEVLPQHAYDYIIDIPAFHMGGTHWYHPHHHGSTALQAGGGAAGMLVVRDAEGEVPIEVSSMMEIPLVLTAIDIELLAELQSEFNEALWQVEGEADSVLLTNGQTAPVVDVTPGQWYRFRIVFVAIATTADLSFDDTSCEMQLLAKDGIYLHTAPRTVETLPLYSGARCDVAVRCSAEGMVRLVAQDGRRRLQGPGPGGPGGPGGLGGQDNAGAAFTTTVLTLEVAGDDAGQADLPEFVVRRPCYVADTRNAIPDESGDVELRPFSINGAAFSSPDVYVDSFEAGHLVELDVEGIAGHPFHLHVNPFQITAITADDSTYFQSGDWHDTLLDGAGDATLRFYTDTFVGHAVLHCRECCLPRSRSKSARRHPRTRGLRHDGRV